MDLSALVSPDPRLNATLIRGHMLVAILARAGASNPRLYAEPTVVLGSGALFIPETPLEKPAEWSDTTRDLQTMGVDQNAAINLSYAVDQDLNGGNAPVERNVAQALTKLDKHDPISGLQEFLDLMPFLAPAQKDAERVALQLPGVSVAVRAAMTAMAKAR